MTEDTTKRALPRRWHVEGAELVGVQKDSADERVAIAKLPAWLAIEGYVAMRSKGAEHLDILSEKARPDRSPSSSARVPEDLKWREAIAVAVAEEETKAGFVGVTKEAKEAALMDGRAYAAKLTKADVKDMQSRSSVIAWYAKLYGDKAPLRTRLPEAAD